jgi:hypothetical protein
MRGILKIRDNAQRSVASMPEAPLEELTKRGHAVIRRLMLIACKSKKIQDRMDRRGRWVAHYVHIALADAERFSTAAPTNAGVTVELAEKLLDDYGIFMDETVTQTMRDRTPDFPLALFITEADGNLSEKTVVRSRYAIFWEVLLNTEDECTTRVSAIAPIIDKNTKYVPVNMDDIMQQKAAMRRLMPPEMWEKLKNNPRGLNAFCEHMRDLAQQHGSGKNGVFDEFIRKFSGITPFAETSSEVVFEVDSKFTRALRRCAQCDSVGLGLQCCSRCRRAYYCNQGCQKTHWTSGGHKGACVEK